MTPEPGAAALILCGGRSSRMGGDKALLPLGGRPAVLVLAERMARFADPVLLAPGKPGRLGPLPFAEVADEHPDAGPLSGIAAGLAACPRRLLAVVAVDMPFASPEVFRLLLRAAVQEGTPPAVVPVGVSGPEPLHAVYATSALPAVRRALARRRYGMRALLQRIGALEVPEDDWRRADPTGRFALNLNRAEDLRLLRAATSG